MAMKSICGSDEWQDRLSVAHDKLHLIMAHCLDNNQLETMTEPSLEGLRWVLMEICRELESILSDDQQKRESPLKEVTR